MAITVTAIKELQEYFNGIMDRANHHANNVDEVILTLAGGVIWKSTDDFKVRTYNGEMANILWMYVDNKTYCFKFDHNSGDILVCKDGHNGNVVATFNNQSTATEIKDFFDKL